MDKEDQMGVVRIKLKEVLSEYSNKSILITGGAGCIGSNLARALLAADPEKIIIVDDLSAGFEWNLPENSKISLVRGSILDDEMMRRAFSFKPQFVFHLAAHFANQNSVDNPETDLMVNGLGTLKTIEYSYLVGVERFVFASSGCSVYGTQFPLPFKEDYISIHLDTPYQINKLVGELYCNYFHGNYGFPVTIGRYFNVYGPHEIPGRYRNVIPNFMWWAIQREPLPITGTGQATRDFTFVEDIVDGTLRLGTFEKAVGKAINLASGEETRIIDLASWINRLAGNDAGVIYKSRREWDKSTRRRASIERAKTILGYEPKTDMKTGLRKTYEWFQSNVGSITKIVSF